MTHDAISELAPDVAGFSDGQLAMGGIHGRACLQVIDGGTDKRDACEVVEGEVRRCRDALAGARPRKPRVLAARLAALGRALEGRYLRTWHNDDLEERLSSWRGALTLLTDRVITYPVVDGGRGQGAR